MADIYKVTLKDGTEAEVQAHKIEITNSGCLMFYLTNPPAPWKKLLAAFSPNTWEEVVLVSKCTVEGQIGGESNG